MTQEIDSQVEYEDFMKSSNAALAKGMETKTGMEEARATAHEDLLATKEDMMELLKVLEGLHAYKGNLHRSCDFIMKNFEKRQEAHTAEIDALVEAKAILFGMQ